MNTCLGFTARTLKIFMAILISANFAIPTAHAELDPNETDFCDLAGQDLLSILDGQWTLQQGAGLAAVGHMTIPLPPSSTSVGVQYDAERGVMDAVSADLQDGMTMSPPWRAAVFDFGSFRNAWLAF